MRFPVEEGRVLGIVRDLFEYEHDDVRFSGLIDEPEAYFTVDCAFAELDKGIKPKEVDYRLPVLDAQDQIRFQELGDPLPLDLDTMGMVGKKVLGVGRTRSYQEGKVGAFAYRTVEEPGDNSGKQSFSFDYLIIGDDDDDFSDGGDSGKLIVTNDEKFRPVGLLWGGMFAQLRHGRMQENWTCATDINYVLNRLRDVLHGRFVVEYRTDAAVALPLLGDDQVGLRHRTCRLQFVWVNQHDVVRVALDETGVA